MISSGQIQLRKMYIFGLIMLFVNKFTNKNQHFILLFYLFIYSSFIDTFEIIGFVLKFKFNKIRSGVQVW